MARPKTFEELADRMEIDELFSRYVTAVDNNEFDLLGSVFTPDAHLAYPEVMLDGDYPKVKAWLAGQRPNMRLWLHLVGNVRVEISGDRASSVSTFFFTGVTHGSETFFSGGEYHDKLVRTPEGWRISERIEHSLWKAGNTPAIPE
jgi:hypothetical protein